MVKEQVSIGQTRLWSPEAGSVPVSPDDDSRLLPPNIDPNKRVAFSRLISEISYTMDLPEDFTDQATLLLVEPTEIVQGLCIGTVESKADDKKNLYLGLGYAATRFLTLARSPHDLANHTFAKTMKANDKREGSEKLDFDEAIATAYRSVAHALSSQISRTADTIQVIAGEKADLLNLYREIRSGGQAHYSAANLDKLRQRAEDIIMTDIEIAGVTLGWPGEDVVARRNALRYNLYGRPGHNNTRAAYWRNYLTMAHTHSKNQLTAARFSLNKTQGELEKYLPFLEDN